MAGEMTTSLKALLSPQMAKYVGSSCSQQLRRPRAQGEAELDGAELGPQTSRSALSLALQAWPGFGDPLLALASEAPSLGSLLLPRPHPTPPQPGMFMPKGGQERLTLSLSHSPYIAFYLLWPLPHRGGGPCWEGGSRAQPSERASGRRSLCLLLPLSWPRPIPAHSCQLIPEVVPGDNQGVSCPGPQRDPSGHLLLNGPQVGTAVLRDTGKADTGDKGWDC